MAAPVVLVAAALVFVFVLSGVAACGGSSAGVDPHTVLAASSAKMKVIQGFHFVYEVHKPASAQPGSGLEIARITGDVNAEGSMKATVDVTESGIPLSLQFVAVSGIHYFKDPLSQKWTSTPAANSPVGTLSLSAGTITILDHITDTSYKGQESKGGTTCYHITGQVAAEQVKQIAGTVDVTNMFPTDIWVGASDSLVYEVDIMGPATQTEVKGIWRSIVLSNLDKPVDIKAPQ
jgi:hypothetical protein